MANVYIVKADGNTSPMTRVRCKNEAMELQQLLECNYNLLPGEQIDPDDPRRWVLVKREMPVPDPSTGVDRWSIDFFFLDQDAVPTFVECKRFRDARARREVVGQVLEYAANAHYYWSKDQIRGLAEQSAKELGDDLDRLLLQLKPNDDLSTDEYFERAEENLRLGQVRLVFFLEESPFELRSLVDFLNKQMQSSEVLLVEAQQFELEGRRVVIPTLFGYTEQARMVKRAVVFSSSSSRRKWDAATFFADASSRLEQHQLEAIRHVYEVAVDLGYSVKWGSGRTHGSCSLVEPAICKRSILSLWSSGILSFNFGWLNGSDAAERFRDRLKELVVTKTSITVPEDFRNSYPQVSIADWVTQLEAICEILQTMAKEGQEGPA